MNSHSGAAVVLICDKNYVLPTVATALSARHHIRTQPAPVNIYVIDADDDWASQFSSVLEDHGVGIFSAPIAELEQFALYHRDRSLPPVALARFWITRFLPPEIDRFLYLDGDIMVDGDLDGLLATRPPEHGLVVAPDNLQLFLNEISMAGLRDRRYLKSIDVRPKYYFNSGVIYTSRAAWNELVSEALQYLMDHSELCRSSDQSALNHAAAGRVVMLSQRYNYQSEHMMVLDAKKAKKDVVIYHFSGGPKPWDSSGWPWSEYFNQFYHRAKQILSGLTTPEPHSPEKQIAIGNVHRARFRQRGKFIYPWRQYTRKRRLDGFLNRGLSLN